MNTLKIVLATLVVSVLVLGVIFAGAIYSGVYNVAASDKHWPITHWTLKQTVKHSVSRHAASVEAPALGSRDQVLAGAANFEAMCSGCHTPPGAKPTPMAKGMYPSPPDLSHSGGEMAANEIFWAIKHGIKASGMPAWGATHGDGEILAMTAFVKQLPEMSDADYQRLLRSAKARGIGHGGDGAG